MAFGTDWRGGIMPERVVEISNDDARLIAVSHETIQNARVAIAKEQEFIARISSSYAEEGEQLHGYDLTAKTVTFANPSQQGIQVVESADPPSE